MKHQDERNPAVRLECAVIRPLVFSYPFNISSIGTGGQVITSGSNFPGTEQNPVNVTFWESFIYGMSLTRPDISYSLMHLVIIVRQIKVYFLFGYHVKVFLYCAQLIKTFIMGRKKGRPVSNAKIDTAVLKYIRATFGNVNKALINAFPGCNEYLTPVVDLNQISFMSEIMTSFINEITPSEDYPGPQGALSLNI